MKLLMENWREYLKEETVDEAWNPFGRRDIDIGPPREKRNKKEAQISGEDFKLSEEVLEYANSLICVLSLHGEAGETGRQAGFPDRDCHKYQKFGRDWWQDDDTFYISGSHEIGVPYENETLSEMLERVIRFYEEHLEPLLTKLIIARAQIENYGKRQNQSEHSNSTETLFWDYTRDYMAWQVCQNIHQNLGYTISKN